MTEEPADSTVAIEKISSFAEKSGSLEEALLSTLRLVCEHTGWPLGHAYLELDRGSGRLLPSRVWYDADPQRFRTFRELTNSTVLEPGKGLLGQVMVTGEPAWVDVTRDSVFLRGAVARHAGIRTALAFPLGSGDGVVGALEFFTDEPVPSDADLLELVREAARVTGTVVERWQRRAESREASEWARLLEESQAATRRLAFLSEASATLASSLDYEATLRNVARAAVPRMADWCAVDLLGSDGHIQRLAVEHPEPAKVDLARELQRRYPTPPDADYGVPRAVRTGEPELVSEIPPDLLERAARSGEHLEILRGLGLRSYVIAPLVARDRILGAVTFAYADSGRRYIPEDLALVTDLARRAGTAIDHAQLVRELEAARDELEQQAEELAAQAEELEEAMEELEASAAELQHANEDLATRSQEAKDAQAAAEEANRAKSQFLAAMSHDLRTPLNAIVGYAQLLEVGIHGELSPAQLQAVDRILSNQQRLLNLVNDVLEFARVEAGQLKLDLRDVSVVELLNGLHPLLEPQIRARSLRYTWPQGDCDLRVHADPERLEQILINLLSNAIKFTAPGGEIRVWSEVDAERVSIHVRDTGPGIPPDKLDLIFEPFVQVEGPWEPKEGGVGLGLAISRDLARSMGGDLVARNAPGEGAVFTCSIPRAPSTP